MQIDSRESLSRYLNRKPLISLFQPIVTLHDLSIIGYEALIRGPSNSPWHSPQMLFGIAEKYQYGCELEQRCLDTHIDRHKKITLSGKLFVNLSARSITHKHFNIERLLKNIEARSIKLDDIVIEITEHHPVSDFSPMVSALERLRKRGIKIAIDDLGAGYSSLRQWSEIRPDYVKIDGHFIQNIHEDAVKRQFVRSICEIASNMGSRVIAEGIESEDELETVRSMEIDYLQGYLIARPNANPVRRISDRLRQFHQNTPFFINEQQVRALSKPAYTVSPNCTVRSLADKFQHDISMRISVVVDNKKPLGVITRNSLQQLFASQYGRDLFSRRKVTTILNRDVIMVPGQMKIERLSNQITTQNESLPDEYFVIVDEQGDYSGVGSLIDLLRAVTEFRITTARHANPLTQLPGNLRINQQVDNLLTARKPFILAYCDLDNFKPFNDTYGYSRGDDVIRELGALLLKSVQSELDFVGHIGGDDFIIIFRSLDWEARCRSILDAMSHSAPRFYDDEHKMRGGITSIDRRGNKQFFEFLSLSIGVVQVSSNLFTSHKEIASISTEVKKEAKKIPGNSLFIDRRSYTVEPKADADNERGDSKVIQLNPRSCS